MEDNEFNKCFGHVVIYERDPRGLMLLIWEENGITTLLNIHNFVKIQIS